MRKIFILIIVLCVFSSLAYSERYEPLIGKSGSVVDFGMIRIISDWSYSAKEVGDGTNSGLSSLHLGLDFGIGIRTELQNRFDYSSVSIGDVEGDYEWTGYTGLMKLRLSEVVNGPALGLGLGARIPFYIKNHSLGVIGGFYLSSALKDIDLDLNIGINPNLTSIETGENQYGKIKYRPPHFANFNILLGYKVLPFFKISAGIEMRHLFGGVEKVPIADDEVQKNELQDATIWNIAFGPRIKPKGYPLLIDCLLAFGLSEKSDYDWKFRTGIQLLPQSPDAEW